MDLWARLRQGDQQARRDFFDEYQPKLRRHFARTLPDAGEAEDCASEVIVRVLEGLAAGTEPEAVDKWLWGIARHVLIERYKASSRPQSRPIDEQDADTLASDDLDDTGTPLTHDVIGKREALAAVRDAIPRLPATQRQAMTVYLAASLREMREVKGARLAAELPGWSAAKVDRELHRAREAVKRQVGLLAVARAVRACPAALGLLTAGEIPPGGPLTDRQLSMLGKHVASCAACSQVQSDSQHSTNWVFGPGLLMLARLDRDENPPVLTAGQSALPPSVPKQAPATRRWRAGSIVASAAVLLLIIVVFSAPKLFPHSDGRPSDGIGQPGPGTSANPGDHEEPGVEISPSGAVEPSTSPTTDPSASPSPGTSPSAGPRPVAPVAPAAAAIPRLRSNSQLVQSTGLYLADLDGDHRAEIVRPVGKELWAWKADYGFQHVLSGTYPAAIQRLVIGHFAAAGREHDRDDVCAILTNGSMQCSAPSPDTKAMWWWFTQSSVVGNGDDAVVGDYNGDGADDILVYTPSTGAVRMFTRGASTTFEPMPGFVPGNLHPGPHLQLRAGEFGRSAGSTDLLVVNPATGVLSRFDSVTDGSGSTTFWWAYDSGPGFIRPSEQVYAARLENRDRDGIAIRTPSTGAIRYVRADWDDGRRLVPITTVALGQSKVTTEPGVLIFGRMGGFSAEPGGTVREDQYFVNAAGTFFTRVDARWDSSSKAYTYWWAYDANVPAPVGGLPG